MALIKQALRRFDVIVIVDVNVTAVRGLPGDHTSVLRGIHISSDVTHNQDTFTFFLFVFFIIIIIIIIFGGWLNNRGEGGVGPTA